MMNKREPESMRLDGLSQLAPLVDQWREQAAEARDRKRREAEHLAREARENSLFQREVADAQPLASKGRIVPPKTPPKPLPIQRQRDEQAVLEQSLSDDIDIEQLLDTDDSLSWRRPEIGPDVPRRLRRGEWTVKSQIDLHGLRVDEAREALVAFIAHASRNEWRCLRIIHGKGLGSPSREPVLKGKVLKWLTQKSEVLAFCQARPDDGGSGALLVLLRGPRNAKRRLI